MFSINCSLWNKIRVSNSQQRHESSYSSQPLIERKRNKSELEIKWKFAINRKHDQTRLNNFLLVLRPFSCLSNFQSTLPTFFDGQLLSTLLLVLAWKWFTSAINVIDVDIE